MYLVISTHYQSTTLISGSVLAGRLTLQLSGIFIFMLLLSLLTVLPSHINMQLIEDPGAILPLAVIHSQKHDFFFLFWSYNIEMVYNTLKICFSRSLKVHCCAFFQLKMQLKHLMHFCFTVQGAKTFKLVSFSLHGAETVKPSLFAVTTSTTIITSSRMTAWCKWSYCH